AHLGPARRLEHADGPRRSLAEEGDTFVDPADRGQGQLRADAVAYGDLGERDAEAARVAVVRRPQEIASGEDEALEPRLEREIDRDRTLVDGALRPVRGCADPHLGAAREEHDVARPSAPR